MRKNRVIFTCQFCQKEFDVPFSETYRRKAGVKFCSLICYHAARWGHTGKCHNCGNSADTKFCTPECQKDYWNKHDYHAYKKAKFWNRKIKLIQFLGGECIKCGNNDIRVLDINHIDRNGKAKTPKTEYTWNRRFRDWEANPENLEVLCANCHRIHTWEQMGMTTGTGLLFRSARLLVARGGFTVR